jgi:hypothetical protein
VEGGRIAQLDVDNSSSRFHSERAGRENAGRTKENTASWEVKRGRGSGRCDQLIGGDDIWIVCRLKCIGLFLYLLR